MKQYSTMQVIGKQDAAPASPRRSAAAWLAAAGLACLLLALLPRHWLEASMARHMLVQLPLLVAAGWLMAGNSGPLRRAASFDQYGVCGLSALLFISAYWMIPRALEQSIDAAPAEAAKFASLMLLGALLPGSLRRAPWIAQLFFLGNFSAMTAIAGMLYQSMPQRLCNAYLLDDQAATGAGLVAGSIAIAILWCMRLAPALSSTSNQSPHHDHQHHLPAGTEPRLDHDPGPPVL